MKNCLCICGCWLLFTLFDFYTITSTVAGGGQKGQFSISLSMGFFFSRNCEFYQKNLVDFGVISILKICVIYWTLHILLQQMMVALQFLPFISVLWKAEPLGLSIKLKIWCSYYGVMLSVWRSKTCVCSWIFLMKWYFISKSPATRKNHLFETNVLIQPMIIIKHTIETVKSASNNLIISRVRTKSSIFQLNP